MTTTDMPDYAIIDGHMHLHSIAEIDGFLEIMEAGGLSAINLVCLVNPNEFNRPADRDLSVNVASMMFKALHPERVFVFGGLDHHTPEVLAGHRDYADQAQTLVDMGVDGFKMWEGKTVLHEETGLPLDSPAYDEFYSLAESESLSIVYHVDRTWRGEIDGVLRKHPRLKIIFAHFYGGGRELGWLGEFLDTWPDACVDLAPGLMYPQLADNRDEAREFFIRYQDRIIFATDNIARDAQGVEWSKNVTRFVRRFLEWKDDLRLAEIDMFGRHWVGQRGLYLNDRVLKKIYARNFERTVGKKPKRVNARIALAECKKLIERVRGDPDKADTLSELETMADTFRAMPQQ